MQNRQVQINQYSAHRLWGSCHALGGSRDLRWKWGQSRTYTDGRERSQAAGRGREGPEAGRPKVWRGNGQERVSVTLERWAEEKRVKKASSARISYQKAEKFLLISWSSFKLSAMFIVINFIWTSWYQAAAQVKVHWLRRTCMADVNAYSAYERIQNNEWYPLSNVPSVFYMCCFSPL